MQSSLRREHGPSRLRLKHMYATTARMPEHRLLARKAVQQLWADQTIAGSTRTLGRKFFRRRTLKRASWFLTRGSVNLTAQKGWDIENCLLDGIAYSGEAAVHEAPRSRVARIFWNRLCRHPFGVARHRGERRTP